MGDRANILVLDEPYGEGHGPVLGTYFYTHWHGSELPQILGEALERGRDRWGDGSYLNRVIFETLLSNASDPLTGFGISARITDNEYPLLVVSHETNRVAVRKPSDGTHTPLFRISEAEGWSFEEYLELVRDGKDPR